MVAWQVRCSGVDAGLEGQAGIEQPLGPLSCCLLWCRCRCLCRHLQSNGPYACPLPLCCSLFPLLQVPLLDMPVYLATSKHSEAVRLLATSLEEGVQLLVLCTPGADAVALQSACAAQQARVEHILQVWR